MKNRLALVCCGIILIMGGAVWYLRLNPLAKTFYVQPLFIKGLRIFAHQWVLPDSVFYDIPSDNVKHPHRSSLRLFEDGKELGPAHSFHLDVVAKGKGRFSHWNGVLIFSASDNTDPRYNHRQYTLLVRPVPRNWELGVGLIGILIGLGWVVLMSRRKRAAPDRARI